MTEEEIGCPPVASTTSKRGGRISVVKTDGTTVGETPTVEPGSEPGSAPPVDAPVESTEAAAVASAPKRRGRPKGAANKGNGRAKSAPAVAISATSGFKVKAYLRFVSTAPDGSRIYFDRWVGATNPDPAEAAREISDKLGKVYASWEKVYLR